MGSYPDGRFVSGRLRAALAAFVTVIALGASTLLGAVAPAAAVGEPEPAVAEAVCDCGVIGDFVEPDPGVAPKTVRGSDAGTGVSPRGGYEVVSGPSDVVVYRFGDRSDPLLIVSRVNTDRRWGFSPDDVRFVTWSLRGDGAGRQQVSWTLYDLSGPGDAVEITGESAMLNVSGASVAFSKSGSRFVIGYTNPGGMTVKIYNTATGVEVFNERHTIEFPPNDPGGGGDPGGPSAPLSVSAKVPKDSLMIDVTWAEPKYHGDSPITGYEVTVSPEPPPGASMARISEFHYRVSGLTPGVLYTFGVVAVNGAGKKSMLVRTKSVVIPVPKPDPPASAQSAEPIEPGVQAGVPAVELPAPVDAPAAPETMPIGVTPGDETGALAALAGSAAWGFSPDEDNRFLLFSIIRDGVPWTRVIDLEAQRTVLDRNIDYAEAIWGFSPCGEAFGMILDAPNALPIVELYGTATGAQIGATVQLSSIGPKLAVQVVGDRLRYIATSADHRHEIADVQTGACEDPGEEPGPDPDPDPEPEPEPPSAPAGVTASGAVGRAIVQWKHPGGADAFRIVPTVDGVPGAPIVVPGDRRQAVIGAASHHAAAGRYAFTVTALADGAASAASARTPTVTVHDSFLPECGVTVWTPGSEEGRVAGSETAAGVRASFEYEVDGRSVVVRDTSTGSPQPATVLDLGDGSIQTWARGADSRVHEVEYRYWGDVVISLRAVDDDGAVSFAAAVVHVAPVGGPANDDFAEADELTGTSGELVAETHHTTCEPGEPVFDRFVGFSQWFRYDAPADGRFVIEHAGGAVNVYEGDELAALVPVHSRTLQGDRSYASMTAGKSYHVQVLDGASAPEELRAAWRLVRPPDNDDRRDALEVDPGGSPTFEGDLAGATIEPGEPRHCNPAPGEGGEGDVCVNGAVASVWYRWTADSDDRVWFSARASAHSQIAYTDSPDAPFGLAEVPLLSKARTGYVGLDQVEGQSYYLQVSASEASFLSTGEEIVAGDMHPAPSNDRIDDAVSIAGVQGSIEGDSDWGYFDAFDQSDDDWRTSDVWYVWTAPADGGVSFRVSAGREIIKPEVFAFVPDPRGGRPTMIAPERVAEIYDPNNPRTTFVAEEGETYLLAVTGVVSSAASGATEGSFQLEWDEALAPGAPTEIAVTESGSGLDLQWLADDGNADIVGYTVTSTPALPEGSDIRIEPDLEHATISGAEPGVEYVFGVTAENLIGTGPTANSEPYTVGDGLFVPPQGFEAPYGVPYSGQIEVRGGTAPYAYQIMGPGWLVVDSATGSLSGVPDGGGVFDIEIQVTDAASRSATRGAIVTVTGAPHVVFDPARMTAVTAVPFSVRPRVTGGQEPYTLSIESGPAWLQVDAATGELSGIPTTEETLDVKVVATDAAGALGRGTLTVEVTGEFLDTIAPEVFAGTSDPEEDGWFTDAVDVTVSGRDDLTGASGIDRIEWVLLDGEGEEIERRVVEDQELADFALEESGVWQGTATVYDGAGNSSTATWGPVRIDMVMPTIDIRGPVGFGTEPVFPLGADVTIDYVCQANDQLSGIRSCTASDGNLEFAPGDKLPTDEPYFYRLDFTVVDGAGLVQRYYDYIGVGAELPPHGYRYSGPPPAPGHWYNEDPYFRFWASLFAHVPVGPASVAEPVPAGTVMHWELAGAQEGSGSGVDYVDVTVNTEGESLLTVWASYPDGTEGPRQEIAVNLDRAAPTVEIASPLDGAVFEIAEVPVAAYSCDDAVSEVVSCVGSVGVGASLATDPGRHELTVTAIDAAGHTMTAAALYEVLAGPGEEPDPGNGPAEEPDPGTGPPPSADPRQEPGGPRADRLAATGVPFTGLDLVGAGTLLAFGLVALLTTRRRRPRV